MQKIINRTPQDWGLYSECNALTHYCHHREVSPNMALATFADGLTARFEVLAHMNKWTDVTCEAVEAVLWDWSEFGAADSEGHTCAANFLIELYSLTEQDAKVAYNQFRYPVLSSQDTRIIDSINLVFEKNSEYQY